MFRFLTRPENETKKQSMPFGLDWIGLLCVVGLFGKADRAVFQRGCWIAGTTTSVGFVSGSRSHFFKSFFTGPARGPL